MGKRWVGIDGVALVVWECPECRAMGLRHCEVLSRGNEGIELHRREHALGLVTNPASRDATTEEEQMARRRTKKGEAAGDDSVKVERIEVFENTAAGNWKGLVTVSLVASSYDEIIKALAKGVGVGVSGAPPDPELAPESEKTEEEPPATSGGRRRRRKAAEPEGPTAEEVAKVAADAAEELGDKIVKEIVADYSESGKIADIPAEKRQDFINEINYNLSDEGEEGED